MLSKLKNNNKIVGTKQAIKAVENHEAEVVYIARDADSKVVGELEELCTLKGITIFYVDTMKDLGKACDIDVKAASAVLLK